MRVSGAEAERIALDQIESQYLDKGFHFVRSPKDGLPKFMGNYLPDAIAIGSTKNIAIEVLAGRGSRSSEKTSHLEKLFEQQDGWELRIIYFSTMKQNISVLPLKQLQAHVQQIRQNHEQFPKGAFLLAWSALEGASRHMFNGEQDLNLVSPRALISRLSTEGYLLGDDVGRFLRFSDMRNQLVHGRLDVEPNASDVKALLKLTETVLKEQKTE